MPDTPFFSVIIPSYNHAHYVCEAIDSVLDQTFSDFEIIVVDDGSTDHTRQAVQAYEHPAIHYIYQDNKGLPGARNTGIRHARGQWIALLDADDLWHRERLAHIAEHIRRHPEFKVFGSPSPETPRLPDSLPSHPPVEELTVRNFLFKSPFSPSSVVIEKSCFDVVGPFTESLKSIEDRDMWLRLATRFRILLIQSDNWQYRLHDAQMSANCPRMLKYYKIVLRDFFRNNPEYRRLKRPAFSFLYRDAGICFIGRRKNRLKGIGYLLISGALHPTALPFRGYPRLFRTKMLIRTLLGGRIAGMARRMGATVST